ncbi:MAG: PAS-domain containing protein [Alphaproteobacteria bacterium]|nr:PAS-domain containing protein [Alphaproteobacteria bacterium]
MTAFDSVLARMIISAFFYPKTLIFTCLVVVLACLSAFYLLLRLHRRLVMTEEKLDLQEETLESFPDGYYLWEYDPIGFIRETYCSRRLAVMMDLAHGTEASFDALLEHFSPDSADLLSAALNALRTNERPFALELQHKTEMRRFLVSGFRTHTVGYNNIVDVLWIRETTETAEKLLSLTDRVRELEKENALFRQAFNSLPFPVWLRNEDLQLALCNTAYAAAVHAESIDQALLLGSELVYEKSPREAKVLAAAARAAGKERKTREYVVMEGKRRWVEASEIPLPAQMYSKNKTIGFVRDITQEQELQNSLQRHIASHNGVLEHLKTAIAVFDAEMRLQFYNTSFMNLWDLEEEELDGSPTYSHVLDMMREKRRLPENRDFNAYKTREIKFFTSLVSATEDILHLPSGVTLRRMLTPHPLGGLLITYEDVTGHLTMERSMTVLNETQFTVVNHLREAILLFGRNGRLKLANAAYLNLWQISDPDFNRQPLSVMEVLEKLRPFFENENNWETSKEQLLGVITSHTGEIFQILRPDGKVLEFIAVGLPDGGIFVSFLDVTEEEKRSSLIEEKETLLSRFRQTTIQAEKLRAVFLEQLSREINPQLSVLTESAQKLAKGKNPHAGRQQKAFLQTIADASAELKSLFKDMTDLALIETGSAVLELNSVDIHALLNGILKIVREQAKNKNITLNLTYPDNLPLLIADQKRLKQVLFYLMNNAVSAAFKDGTISLSVQVENKNLIIAIEEQSLNVKNDSDTVNFAAQNGFAAALIRNFIEMHGGTLAVSDKKGTKKTQIYLPIH